MTRDAPLVWRFRNQLGLAAFYLAIGIVALGGWTILRGGMDGDWPSVGVGITLVVGGLLIMVGRRNRERARRKAK